MKSEWAALARHRFQRARETFQDGVALLERGAVSSAVNRLYYAAFYAARALLATEGLDASRHSGVITLFGQRFVKNGIIPPEIAKALPRSFEKRLDTDYEDFSAIDQKEAETVRQDVERFLQTCEQVLEARFSNSKGLANG